MLYQINDGTVSLGGNVILDHIDFEIRGTEKIAVTGANGAGKTTLLQVLSGELELDGDDKRMGPGITMSRRLTVGMLKQGVFTGDDRTVEEELLAACPCKDTFERERFEYEQEYDRLFTGFGLKREDKKRLLSSFSGGEKTKIALIRLLLEKPEILILDEPTNHLDLNSIAWLETYLLNYQGAVLIVSHDRYFLNKVVTKVLEIELGELRTYMGNYSDYAAKKQQLRDIRLKEYLNQQQEIKHQEAVIEKLRSFNREKSIKRAESREKMLEKMQTIEKPIEVNTDIHLKLEPSCVSGNDVLTIEHLSKSFPGQELFTDVNLEIKRGEHVAVIGDNGTGKTTLAKVIANTTSADFRQINATVAGKKDMEDVVEAAKNNLGMYGRRTILFVDEIHRFNKGQQDYLLPFVEVRLYLSELRQKIRILK